MIQNNKFIRLFSSLFIASMMIVSCSDDDNETVDKTYTFDEVNRPQVHFTPAKGWMNDPNGMVYVNGEYHLYYQYNPYASEWGYMSWGHAVSTDLVHWKHAGVPMAYENNEAVFSGSAVVDKNNTAGFGANAIIYLYTINGSSQTQGLAYSTDNGYTIQKYTANPVISNPGITDFRDPKVFWHEASGKWVMALATQQTITFYNSPNLIDWTKLSEFGNGIGGHDGVWECPDLIEMDYNGTKKWVLLTSVNPGGPNSGSATQYFVGNFDGTTFTADSAPYPLWFDFGRDSYAGVTWSNAPEGRHLFIGWMSNWQYANIVPTTKWRGAMTLPRELSLAKHPNGHYIVTSKIVPEINNIAEAERNVFSGNATTTETNVALGLSQDVAAYQLNAKLNFTGTELVYLDLSNDSSEVCTIAVDKKLNVYTVDRREAGSSSFYNNFATVSSAPLNTTSSTVDLQIYVDQSSVEVIVNDGVSQQTNIMYPKSIYTKLTVRTYSGLVGCSVSVREFNSIWN